MFQLDSEPQRATRIWLRGLELGWLAFGRLFGLAALFGLIGLLPTFYIAGRLGDAALTRDSLLQLLRTPHFVMNFLLLELLVLVCGSFVNALIIRKVERTASRAAAARDLRFVTGKLPALVLAGILATLTLLVGMLIAAVVGGILGALATSALGRAAAVGIAQICVLAAMLFIVVNLMFFPFAIVLEGKGPVAALNHSSALVWRNWWRTFLVLLITVAVVAACAAVVMLPLSLPLASWWHTLADVDTGRSLLIKGVLRLVATAVFMPFIIAILYVQYRDLRLRHAPPAAPTASLQA